MRDAPVSLGAEELDTFRAAVVNVKEKLDQKDWERSASAQMRMVWLADCKSTVNALERPILTDISDKHLIIEVASLRQHLWHRYGEDLGDLRLEDQLPEPDEVTDQIRWMDTDVMIVDSPTKIMSYDKLMEVLWRFWTRTGSTSPNRSRA